MELSRLQTIDVIQHGSFYVTEMLTNIVRDLLKKS